MDLSCYTNLNYMYLLALSYIGTVQKAMAAGRINILVTHKIDDNLRLL